MNPPIPEQKLSALITVQGRAVSGGPSEALQLILLFMLMRVFAGWKPIRRFTFSCPLTTPSYV